MSIPLPADSPMMNALPVASTTELASASERRRILLRTLGLGLGAMVGLGAVGLGVGAPTAFALGLLISPLVASFHMAVLCVPGLLVAQAMLDLEADPHQTATAFASGLRQGSALLAAALPLVLFFGVSLGTPWHVAALAYFTCAAALAATLGQSIRTLLLADPSLPARVTYLSFGALAFVIGLIAGTDAVSLVGGAL